MDGISAEDLARISELSALKDGDMAVGEMSLVEDGKGAASEKG